MPEHYQICEHPEDKDLLQRERSKYQGIETFINQTRPADFIEPHMVDKLYWYGASPSEGPGGS